VISSDGKLSALLWSRSVVGSDCCGNRYTDCRVRYTIVAFQSLATWDMEETLATPDALSVGIYEVLRKVDNIRVLIESIIVLIEEALVEFFVRSILKLSVKNLDITEKLVLEAAVGFG